MRFPTMQAVAAALVMLALAGCGEKKTESGQGGLVVGKLGGGGGGAGWSNTNEGQVIAAAFLDAHNPLLVQVRALQAKELPPPVATKAKP